MSLAVVYERQGPLLAFLSTFPWRVPLHSSVKQVFQSVVWAGLEPTTFSITAQYSSHRASLDWDYSKTILLIYLIHQRQHKWLFFCSLEWSYLCCKTGKGTQTLVLTCTYSPLFHTPGHHSENRIKQNMSEALPVYKPLAVYPGYEVIKLFSC